MKRYRGFTLIELLVVIGIIAILISILIPVLHKVRQNAYAAVCQSNMRQLITAFILFANDHHDHLPSCGYDSQDGHEDWFYGRSILFEDAPYTGSVYRYLKSPNVYLCPGVERVPNALGGTVPNDYAMWPAISGAFRSELKEAWFGKRSQNYQFVDKGWLDTDFPRAHMAFPVLVQWDLHHPLAETSFPMDRPVSKFQQDFMEHCHHGGSYIAFTDGNIGFYDEPPIPWQIYYDQAYWWGVRRDGRFSWLDANIGWNRFNH